ncbi:hypothetical protein Tco_0345829 [Tanacetum coccineum]
MSLTNMLILLHYLESFKSEFADVFVFNLELSNSMSSKIEHLNGMRLSLPPCDPESLFVTSLIHIESRKSPTAMLFDDDTGGLPFVIVILK